MADYKPNPTYAPYPSAHEHNNPSIPNPGSPPPQQPFLPPTSPPPPSWANNGIPPAPVQSEYYSGQPPPAPAPIVYPSGDLEKGAVVGTTEPAPKKSFKFFGRMYTHGLVHDISFSLTHAWF